MATFAHIRTNELSTEGTAWFAQTLAVIESLDVPAYLQLMTDDVEIVLPGGTMKGREEVGTGLSHAWSDLASITHDEVNIYGTDHRFVHETVTTTVTTSGDRKVARATVWIDRDADGAISSARIY